MAQIIRKTYPPAFSFGLLGLIYVMSFLLSQQIFDIEFSDLDNHAYMGMFLASTAVITMILILWEELLFPIKLKNINGGLIFRNHRSKLQTQLLIYFTIPSIFTYLYLNYETNLIRFLIVSGICIILPIVGKIASGIKNYNDFLIITDDEVKYKDNEKEGRYKTIDIETFTIITHEINHFHQIELTFTNNDKVVIDLHEMELEEYYDSIYNYLKIHFPNKLREIVVN